MSGHELHVIPREQLPGTLAIMGAMFSGSSPEVRELIGCMKELSLASMNIVDDNTLRAPLIGLIGAIHEHHHRCISNPEKLLVLLLAKAFALQAMTIVQLDTHSDRVAAPVSAVTGDNSADLVQPQLLPQPPPPAASRVSLRIADRRAMVKNEDFDYPAVAPKRRRTLPASFLSKKADNDASAVGVIEMKKCDHCAVNVLDDDDCRLRHAWEHHKEKVYKYILRPDMVCEEADCDYIGAALKNRKKHEWMAHNNPDRRMDPLPELIAGNCTYCKVKITSLVGLKRHLLSDCKTRDERPILGCTSCDQTFHFIYDFVCHLRLKGSMTHGRPVLLRPE